jgi:hypothetical protein
MLIMTQDMCHVFALPFTSFYPAWNNFFVKQRNLLKINNLLVVGVHKKH